MKRMNVFKMPLAANVCDQLLREVDQSLKWSVAHVLMNPKAWSLLHEHREMDEIYIITRGTGYLIRGGDVFVVQAGDVIWIPRRVRHKLINTSAASLEHLVLAVPPFDSSDIYLDESWQDPVVAPKPLIQPPVSDCFDGAKIVAYELENIATSITFGWVTADPTRHKQAHYHKITDEWVYVVEGRGYIEINGIPHHTISHGDWIHLSPGETHVFRNYEDQHMVIVCICTPCFCMDDVYYR